MSTRPEVALFIDPPSHHFLEDRLFDSKTVPHAGDDILAPYVTIRAHFAARGIPVHTIDRIDGISPSRRAVCVSMGMLTNYPRLIGRPDTVLSAFFAMECPIVEPSIFEALPEVQRHFKRIYSWSDSESLLPFTGRNVPCERFQWPQSFDRVHEPLWSRKDRKFLVMINANKLPRLYWQELYTKRLLAVEYFERFGEVDLYGREWDKPPHRVGKTWVPWTARRIYRALWEVRQRILPRRVYAAARRAYRGPAASKSETLARYDFALCFENMILKGWMTEKLFDCLFAGTVPIYWGAPDVQEFVPKECFVDMRRFKDFGELRAFLKGLSPAEVQKYREAGRAYLESPRFDPFRKTTFLAHFRKIVREDAGADA